MIAAVPAEHAGAAVALMTAGATSPEVTALLRCYAFS